MNITELIEEAEDCRKLGLESNALILLPLLVAVIKNQQRQIGLASNALYRLTDFHGNQRANEAITAMKEVAAELEDVKP